MLRIFHNTKYDFIRVWRWALGITVVFIVLGLGTFAFSPINYSVEFTGGHLMDVRFAEAPHVDDLRAMLERGGVPEPIIQEFGGPTEYTIRARADAKATVQTAAVDTVDRIVRSIFDREIGAGKYEMSSESVGPRVGQELQRGALLAVLASFGLTLLYLAWRFEWRFGAAAVVATAHDVLATLAFIKLMNLEVSLTIIAGILTVIGYSLNDTIIIFDRVRENLRKKRKEPMYDTLNRSINETLPRSVMTHMTTLAATVALLIFAGPVIRPFAWVMAFGIATGTFSSIYVAGPVLLWIERRWPRELGDKGGIGARVPREKTERPATAPREPTPARR